MSLEAICALVIAFGLLPMLAAEGRVMDFPFGLAYVVACSHGVPVVDLFRRTRVAHIVRARQALWTALHERGIGYRRIARAFGRDPSTVRAGIDAHLNRQPRRVA